MHRTQGIILSSEKLGETDKLLSLFSKEFGKLKVVAQGALKYDSKMRSIVQTGHVIDCVIMPLRSGRFRLTSPSLIEAFSNSRNDKQKLSIALFSLGLLDRVLHEEERDEKLWKFYHSWLSDIEIMNFNPDTSGNRMAQWFSARLLSALGGLAETKQAYVPTMATEALNPTIPLLDWGELQQAYQISLGFSLPRYFLIQ